MSVHISLVCCYPTFNTPGRFSRGIGLGIGRGASGGITPVTAVTPDGGGVAVGAPIAPGSSITIATTLPTEPAAPVVSLGVAATVLSRLPSLSHTVLRSVALRPNNDRHPNLFLAIQTAFTGGKHGGQLPGVSDTPLIDDCFDPMFVDDGFIQSPLDAIQSLPIFLSRCSGRPLTLGTDALGQPVATNDVQWWFQLNRLSIHTITFGMTQAITGIRRTRSAGNLVAADSVEADGSRIPRSDSSFGRSMHALNLHTKAQVRSRFCPAAIDASHTLCVCVLSCSLCAQSLPQQF